MAERTGLNVILGSGWYRETYYWPYAYQTKTSRLAEDIVTELTVGIDGTDVRAGIIGEIGCRRTRISAAEERMLRAAARAHKETGVTIATSALRGPSGLEQLDILEEEGVDPSPGDYRLRPHVPERRLSRRDSPARCVHLF